MPANLVGVDRGYYFNEKKNVTGNFSTQHYHPDFEIYYMKDGKCNYFIEDRSYDVMAGDVVLIPAGVIHRTNYGSRPYSRLLINFPDSYVSEDVLAASKSLGNIYRNYELVPKIEKIFRSIEREYMRNDALTPRALTVLTEGLLLLMLRNEGEKNCGNDRNGVVENTVRYIQHNYSNDVRLRDVAKIMNVSPEYLSRLFKKETSFGFNEYLTLYRLQKAEYILVNDKGRTISDIAYSCGFNDSNYFSYKFKTQYGITPTEAREKGAVLVDKETLKVESK